MCSKLTNDKYGSLWFQIFMVGCEVHMGVVWKSNQTLSVGLLLDVIQEAELQLQYSADRDEEHQWLPFVTYASISYDFSLHGSKGFLLDLKGLHANWLRSSGSYFIVALLGNIKG